MISVLDGQHGAPAGKKAPAEKAMQLSLFVSGCEPQVWRRLLVRESMWLQQLHDAIQVLFEWYDYQVHEFAAAGTRYGNPFNRGYVVVEDDPDVTLADIDLAGAGRMLYHYHFGEGWTVEIGVEKILPLEKKQFYPVCVAGARAGPPEDCGGAEAYNDMLECVKTPHTDIGQEWLAWLGPEYDPEKCDLEAINEQLRQRPLPK